MEPSRRPENPRGRHHAAARILVAFERAERETDPQRRAALLTSSSSAPVRPASIAGTIAELAQRHAAARLPHIDTHRRAVVLIEPARVLAGFADDLSPMRSARSKASALK